MTEQIQQHPRPLASPRDGAVRRARRLPRRRRGRPALPLPAASGRLSPRGRASAGGDVLLDDRDLDVLTAAALTGPGRQASVGRAAEV